MKARIPLDITHQLKLFIECEMLVDAEDEAAVRGLIPLLFKDGSPFRERAGVAATNAFWRMLKEQLASLYPAVEIQMKHEGVPTHVIKKEMGV